MLDNIKHDLENRYKELYRVWYEWGRCSDSAYGHCEELRFILKYLYSYTGDQIEQLELSVLKEQVKDCV